MADQIGKFSTPLLASGALFVRQDSIFLVHKTYANGWDIPGGYVDNGESPATACEREVREELGLHKTPIRVLVHDWAPSDSEGDKLLYVFDCGQIEDGEECEIQLQSSEIDTSAWVKVDDLRDYVIPRLERRLATAFRAYESRQFFYLEHGKPVLRINTR